MAEFKVGDIVRLKSGGPRMTVETVGEDMAKQSFVSCAWFNTTPQGSEKLTETFPPEALQHVQK